MRRFGNGEREPDAETFRDAMRLISEMWSIERVAELCELDPESARRLHRQQVAAKRQTRRIARRKA